MKLNKKTKDDQNIHIQNVPTLGQAIHWVLQRNAKKKKEKYHLYFKTKVMLLTYQLLLSHYIMSSSFLEPMDCSLPETSVCGISLYSQEYRIGLSFPSPQDLPNPGIELTCVSWLAGLFFVAESLGNPYISVCSLKINVCKH